VELAPQVPAAAAVAAVVAVAVVAVVAAAVAAVAADPSTEGVGVLVDAEAHLEGGKDANYLLCIFFVVRLILQGSRVLARLSHET